MFFVIKLCAHTCFCNYLKPSYFQTLRVPLSLKYSCPSESTWKLAVSSLLKVLSIGLPVARQHASSGKFDTMWPELANTFEDFLFTKRSVHSFFKINILKFQEVAFYLYSCSKTSFYFLSLSK